MLQRIFGTTALTLNQWLICIGLALTLLVVEELVKVVLRRRLRPDVAVAVTATPAMAY